jgi:hypothetical protein
LRDKVQVFVRKNSPSGNLADKNKNLAVSHYRARALSKEKTYGWGVKACNAHGCAGTVWQTFKIQ